MTPRYNPFTQIHKGLRALLYDTALALQHNDFNNERTTALVADQVQKVLWLFEGHAHTEDSMVFPLIAQHAPGLVADFEAQHEKDHALGQAVQDKLEALAQCQDTVSREMAGTALQQAFECFVAFNLEHMVMEETLVAPIIWQHYSDEALHALTGEIVRSLPADKNEQYTNWMILGLNDVELIQWLTGVRQTAPSFVFDSLCTTAQQLLKESRWQKLQQGLQTSQSMAC